MDKMAERGSRLLAIQDVPETCETENLVASDLAESPSKIGEAEQDECDGSEDDPVQKMQKALQLRDLGKGKKDAETSEKKPASNLGAKAKSFCALKKPAASKLIKAKAKAQCVMKVTPKAKANKAGYTHRLMYEMEF